MDSDDTDSNKTARPHAHFDAPHEVVVDPALSKEQKIEALDSLEQDARQLAIASSEGMSDGEATGLQEVLHARNVLEMPPLSIAYEVVLQDLHLRLTGVEGDEMRMLLQQTIAALKAISMADQSNT
jgi:hypothetical protein